MRPMPHVLEGLTLYRLTRPVSTWKPVTACGRAYFHWAYYAGGLGRLRYLLYTGVGCLPNL